MEFDSQMSQPHQVLERETHFAKYKLDIHLTALFILPSGKYTQLWMGDGFNCAGIKHEA